MPLLVVVRVCLVGLALAARLAWPLLLPFAVTVSPTATIRIATVATTAKKREGTADITWTFCRRIVPIIGFNRSDLQKTKTTWKCVCGCVCVCVCVCVCLCLCV